MDVAGFLAIHEDVMPRSDTARPWLFAGAFGGVLAVTIAASMFAADSSTDRIKELHQLIDAVASRNQEPKTKVTDDTGTTFALFNEKYDWTDHKRVQAAIWTLSQKEDNQLWWQLTEHFDDKRYSFCLGEQGLWVEIWSVGDICRATVRSQLLCAYLQHLQPGKTAPMSGDSPNSVPDTTKDFLPKNLQLKLHNPPQLGECFSPERDGINAFKAWCFVRKGKLLYELQIEMCKWAVETVENAPNTAERPQKDFIRAVKKQIALLEETKKPVIDRSVFASPIWRAKEVSFDAESAKEGWNEFEKTKGERKK